MYYEKTLYPIQDKFLEFIDRLGTGFYLTGGTALSRFYYNHRYSDDLDFFVNDDPKFKDYITVIQKALPQSGMQSIVEVSGESFFRLKIDGQLKIDFVNDIPAYYGETNIRPGSTSGKIDNPMNILANKITAFNDRQEAKDVSDIWVISKNNSINWETIFTATDSKAAGISPPLTAKRLDEFDFEKLDRINWITKPNMNVFKTDVQKIIKDMLNI